MRRAQRIGGALAFTVCVVVGTAASAHAAGGNGVSVCSFATGPSGPYNLGESLRARQPFGGDNNPGFAGPGFSPFCQPPK
ncbi:MAG: hypothetical protein QOC92_2910 [Acidimicrobiaceae bacterium]|jgi:hypothetical protein